MQAFFFICSGWIGSYAFTNRNNSCFVKAALYAQSPSEAGNKKMAGAAEDDRSRRMM